MKSKEIVEKYAKEIRRIAGIYQSEGDLSKAKRRVNLTLKELGHINRTKLDLQIINWNELNLLLYSHFNSCSDIRWITVIKYARARVNARRAGAVKKLKTKDGPVISSE